MLAAILCNIPFPVRGGGPFLPKYGYFGYRSEKSFTSCQTDDECEEVVAEVVIEKIAPRIVKRIQKAVEVETLDADAIYLKAIERIKARLDPEVARVAREMNANRVLEAAKRAAAKREQDDEEMMIVALL